MVDSTSPDRLPKVLPKVLPKALAKPLAKLLLGTLATLAVAASVLLAVALPIAVPEPTPAAAQTTTARVTFAEDDASSVKADLVHQGVTYSFAPDTSFGAFACTETATVGAVPKSSNPAGFEVVSGNYRHNLNLGCNWNFTLDAGPCRGVTVVPVTQTGTPAKVHGTQTDLKYGGETTQSVSFLMYGALPNVADFSVYTDTAGTPTGIDDLPKFFAFPQLNYTFHTKTGCSEKPYLGLPRISTTLGGEKSGLALGNTTTDTTPELSVVLPRPVTNSTITLTATQGTSPNQTTITQTKTGLMGTVADTFTTSSPRTRVTSAAHFNFDDACTKNGVSVDPCTLDNGVWTVTARHTDGSKTAVDSTPFTLNVEGPSSKPTVTLHTESRTGDTPTATAGATNDTTPKFTVGNVVAGASVTLTYEKTGTPAVTTSATTVAANATTVDVTLPTLAQGDWTVKATHTDGTNDASDSDDFTLTVDTVAPTVTITADETSLTVGTNPTATVKFVISEPDTGFMSNHAINTNTAGATLTSLTPHGTEANTWEATLTIASTVTALTTATITVVSNAFNDAAGNGNTVATFGMPLHPQAGSLKPSVALAPNAVVAGNDTGSSPTDGETSNTEPTFRVTFASAIATTASSSSTVTVEATIGDDPNKTTVSRSWDVAANSNVTMVDIPFSGNTNCTRNGTADQSCELSTDGEWMVTASHTATNHAKTDSVSITVDIDTDAPAIASISSASTSVNTAASITFMFDEPVTDFTSGAVTVTPSNTNNYSWGPVSGSGTTWMIPFTATAVNTYTLAVPLSTTVKDIAGNTLAAPASTVSGSVAVASAPLSPAPMGLALKDADSDTGSSATDRITSNTNPSFTVTLPDTPEGRMSSTVKVTARRGGDTISRSMTGVTATSVNIDFTDDNCTKNGTASQSCMLAHGTTAWTVTASNLRDGNFSEASLATPIMVTVDTAAPTVNAPVADPATGSARSKGYSATDGDDNTAAPTTWVRQLHQDKAITTCAPTAPMAVTSSPTAYQAQSYDEGDTVTVAAEADNGRTLCFWSTDVAGNTGNNKITIAGIDRTDPTITISGPASGVANSKSVTGTAADTGGSGVASFGYIIDDDGTCPTDTATYTTHASGTAVTVDDDANDDKYVCFFATDNAGNTKVMASGQITDLDTTDPTITITGPASGAANSKLVTGTAADAGGSGVASFGYIIDDDGTCPTDTSTYTAHTSGTAVTVDDDANDDKYVCFFATDNAGNTKVMASGQITDLDTTDPTITITQQPSTTAATSKSVTATAADAGSGVASFGYIIDDDGTCPTDTTTYTAHTSGTAVSITDDANNEDYVCFFATDNVGRTVRQASNQITNLDTTDPTITISGPASGAANSKSVTGTAADTGGSGVASFGYIIDDDGTCPTDTATYTTHASGTAVTVDDDANDDKYVCFFATDNAGNTKVMASGQITDLDTTDPTITITGPASGAANSKSVTGTAADAGGSGVASFGYIIDDDGTCPTDTSTYTAHTSGTAVTVDDDANDDKYVCFFATDNAGNTKVMASGQITDLDTTDPTITITQQPSTTAATSKSVTATAADAGSGVASFGYIIDDDGTCPTDTTTYTAHTSGTAVSITDDANNEDYVCFYATDNAGNSKVMASNQITGLDTTAPDFSDITMTPDPVKVGSTALLVFTARESITGFAFSEIDNGDDNKATLAQETTFPSPAQSSG